MKHFALTAVILISTLEAITLDDVISKALQNSPSLDVISERINANKESIKLSTNFKNPKLSLNVNDINFDDYQNRALEPMQTQSFTIEQQIPYFGKRAAQKSIAQQNEKILRGTLESAKSQLIFAIKESAYKIWQIERFKDILDEYISITKQELEIYASYTKESMSYHIDMASSELSLFNLELERENLDATLKSLYAAISYLSADEIESLEIELNVVDFPEEESYLSQIKSNPDLKVKESDIDLQSVNIELKELELVPDISFMAGYYNREKFDDYLSVGVAFSIPLYSSEKYKLQSEKYKMLQKRGEKRDMTNMIRSQLKQKYASLESSYNRYKILSEKNLAHLDHMFDILNSSISIGADLLKVNTLLKRELDVRKKIVEEVTNFNIARAKLDSLVGAVK